MKTYKHIFFDLDDTLWDFDTNSKNTLTTIFQEENLAANGLLQFDSFYKEYEAINSWYWVKYYNQEMTQEELRINRFYDTMRKFGVDNKPLAERISEQYLTLSPLQTELYPDCLEVLTYLQSKYKMHIITNGFKDVQIIKMRASGLTPFFENLFISEEIGFQKPSPEIFQFAMQKAQTNPLDSIMIGDNMNTDIAGAKSVGMDQVFFNPKWKDKRSKVTHEIRDLIDLKQFL